MATENDNHAAGEGGGALDSLAGSLGRFGRTRKRWAVLEALGRLVLLGPGLLLAWALADWAFRLPAWPLVVLFAAACAAGLAAAAVWLLPRALRRIDPAREALQIETRHGRLDNLLIGAWQLGGEAARPPRGPPRHSLRLVEALVARAARELAGLQPERLLDLRAARRTLAGAGGVAAACALLGLLAPAVVRERAARLQDAWLAVLDSLFPVTLTVEPGDVAVVRGQPVSLRVAAAGARRPGIELRMTDEESGEESRVALALAGGRAAHTVEKALKTFRYEFVYGRRRSATATIRVGDRPEIGAISFEFVYPAYTGQPPRPMSGRLSRVQALAGTSVLVSFAATTELHPELSYVEWRGGRQAISVNGRFGHFSFPVEAPERAVVRLTGRYGRGFEMDPPLSFEVAVDKDQAPSVLGGWRRDRLVMLADEAAALVVPYTAEDDFGVTEVTLNYRLDTIDPLLGREPRSGSVTRAVDPASERTRGKFEEVFKGLTPALQPGDRLRIELAARDNNTETGPGVGRSRALEVVVVQADLAQFTDREFGFGESELLGGLHRLKRATNLLVPPERMVRTEKDQPAEKQALASRVGAETWPSGAEDMVGDYFRLLSGGR